MKKIRSLEGCVDTNYNSLPGRPVAYTKYIEHKNMSLHEAEHKNMSLLGTPLHRYSRLDLGGIRGDVRGYTEHPLGRMGHPFISRS